MPTSVPIQSATGRDYPIADYQNITQGYHIANNRYAAGYHTGIDFGVPTGTPVYAAEGGTVIQAQDTGKVGYGKQVLIKDWDGTYELYGHLSAVGVRQGDQLETGTQIAQSGNTGNSTGAHLHFEVRSSDKYGTDIDPLRWLGLSTSATTHAGTVKTAGYNPNGVTQAQPATILLNPATTLKGVGDFFSILTNGAFWVRVLEIAFGILLTMFGIAIFTKGSFIPGAGQTLSAIKSIKK